MFLILSLIESFKWAINQLSNDLKYFCQQRNPPNLGVHGWAISQVTERFSMDWGLILGPFDQF